MVKFFDKNMEATGSLVVPGALVLFPGVLFIRLCALQALGTGLT